MCHGTVSLEKGLQDLIKDWMENPRNPVILILYRISDVSILFLFLKL